MIAILLIIKFTKILVTISPTPLPGTRLLGRSTRRLCEGCRTGRRRCWWTTWAWGTGGHPGCQTTTARTIEDRYFFIFNCCFLLCKLVINIDLKIVYFHFWLLHFNLIDKPNKKVSLLYLNLPDRHKSRRRSKVDKNWKSVPPRCFFLGKIKVNVCHCERDQPRWVLIEV